MIPIKKIRGTKDILPRDIRYWQVVEKCTRKILESANYKEIRTPILENENLFMKSIGTNTDIVSKEMYSFKDQGNRKITLRPEGTAGIIRSYIENQLYLENSPQRLWYCGPMFRYERPQLIRQRQFHQLGIECIGSLDNRADAEIIYLVSQILNTLEIENFQVYINSIGNFQDRENYKKALIEYLTPYKDHLDADSQIRLSTNPLRILDSKDINTQELLQESPSILDFLNNDSQKKFEQLCQYLKVLEINYIIDPRLVRGLDYYTHTAFEIRISSSNSQNTICGGGRYDLLVEQLGGPKISAVGCAIGLERLIHTMQKNKEENNIDFHISAQGESAKLKSLTIMKFLRSNGFCVFLDLNETNFNKQIKKAIKLDAKACILIGEQECLNQNITIKWLKTFKQENISDQKLEKYVKTLIIDRALS